MNICYTYYVNPNDINTVSAGFSIPKFFFDCAELSIQLSDDNDCDNIVIYTDYVGKDILDKNVKNISKCEFVLVDWNKYDFDKRYWNFPKLITYTLQNDSFLHIDFDVFLDKYCLKEIDYEADIFTEKLRDYTFDKSFVKFCSKKKILPQTIICSGLLGGSNIKVFRDNFNLALDVCKPTTRNIGFMDLVAIEEFALTIKAIENELTCYEINPNRFIHFQGEAKHFKYFDSINKCREVYEKEKEFVIVK